MTRSCNALRSLFADELRHGELDCFYFLQTDSSSGAETDRTSAGGFEAGNFYGKSREEKAGSRRGNADNNKSDEITRRKDLGARRKELGIKVKESAGRDKGGNLGFTTDSSEAGDVRKTGNTEARRSASKRYLLYLILFKVIEC